MPNATSHSMIETTEKLWKAFRAAPSEETVVALVEHYIPLVRRIVSSMAVYTPPDMDQDDLLQHALLGLWFTIERFDSSRGVSFESYALPRIRGAVRDALRHHDPLTRTDRTLLKTLQQFVADYAQQHQTVPDEKTMAEYVGIPIARLRDLTARAQSWLSLDALLTDDAGQNLADRLVDSRAPDPAQETVRHEYGALFRQAFRRLPDRQQKILYLYYYEDLTLKQIGAIFEITEARVCQLHGASLLALKSMLSTDAQVSVASRSKKP